ncbi:hypothetical protein V8G54_006251 [Vigna mungo]|uniref:Hydrophobic seed protein domain-containing protein n=1 Tax=Vigna mungo TaxID=3915 RepID=A0AAQ3NZI6_VIGMU
MGSSKYVGLLLLSLSLVSVSMVRSQTCPNGVSACGSLFNVVNVTLGGSPTPSCCSVLPGLNTVQAGICIRNAIITGPLAGFLPPPLTPFLLLPVLGPINLNATITTIIRTCNVTGG